MKELFTPFTNWRVHVLAALALVALVLLASESSDDTSLLTMLSVKAAGFAIAYAAYRLGRYWDGKGKINELMQLAKEED